jgi:hypothetical protein
VADIHQEHSGLLGASTFGFDDAMLRELYPSHGECVTELVFGLPPTLWARRRCIG